MYEPYKKIVCTCPHKEEKPKVDLPFETLFVPPEGPPLDILELLPPELWDYVIQKVDDPKDLLSCCKTSKVWEKLLKDSKPSLEFQVAIPILQPYLSRNEILRCSQMSQACNQAVDACIDKIRPINSYTQKRTKHQLCLLFESTESILKFMESCEIPELALINPVVKREVRFHFNEKTMAPDYDEHRHLYFETMFAFLEKYGSLVKYFELSVWWRPPNIFELVKIIWKSLHLIPNVKEVCNIFYWRYGPGPEQALQIREFLEQNALPELPHLNTLKLYVVPTQIVDMFMKKYEKQMKHLQLYRVGRHPEDED